MLPPRRYGTMQMRKLDDDVPTEQRQNLAPIITELRANGVTMVCISCGIVGADARPNWKEQPPRESPKLKAARRIRAKNVARVWQACNQSNCEFR
jgi:hypothetical protein